MLTVHTIVGSPFGRAVIAACIEKNAAYRLRPLTPCDHRQLLAGAVAEREKAA